MNLPQWFDETLNNYNGLLSVYEWFIYGKITTAEFNSIFQNASAQRGKPNASK